MEITASMMEIKYNQGFVYQHTSARAHKIHAGTWNVRRNEISTIAEVLRTKAATSTQVRKVPILSLGKLERRTAFQ